MNYIEKLAKRILAKDYYLLGKKKTNTCVIIPNEECSKMIENKKYKYFLLLYLLHYRAHRVLKDNKRYFVSTWWILNKFSIFNIKSSTLKQYLSAMVKDKILIKEPKELLVEELYSFNPEYFDTYLLTDYKTIEE